MTDKILSWCNFVIEYCFYALFFIVPLTFTSTTYELFEFNKMWLTFFLTIIIVCAWITKMILHGKLFIAKTPLDIPILLFLISQFVSTIYSLDPHVSYWGYYSRFNGGLLSIIAYITLFYGLVSNIADFKKSVTAFSVTKFFLSFVIPIFVVFLGLIASSVSGLSIFFILFVLAGFVATVSFLHGSPVQRLLHMGLVGGATVAMWGLPSHFGYDPTCLLFRGTFDVSCWTDAFQPKIRIFSTLGQPNWLAAYLAVLTPITIGLILQFQISNFKSQILKYSNLISYFLFLISILFYFCLIYTGSQSGYLGLVFGLVFLLGFLVIQGYFRPSLRGDESTKQSSQLRSPRSARDDDTKSAVTPGVRTLGWIIVVFALIAFFVGQPIHFLERFTFSGIHKQIFAPTTLNETASEKPTFAGELGGTDSGTIRRIVWDGALEIWKKNPLIGSGVETFAFSYYANRPQEHNMTSEWDYLYNKAHNEYLNFLATTGVFGLGSYLLMIGAFLWVSIRQISNTKFQIHTNSKLQKESPHLTFDIGNLKLVVIGLLASYITILVSNFFGFSVVIINIYFFLIPAFVLLLLGIIDTSHMYELKILSTELWRKHRVIPSILTTVTILVFLFVLLVLTRYWLADRSFAKGFNLNRAGQFQLAYTELRKAIMLRASEPTFLDEYSYNTATIAVAFHQQNNATHSAQLRQESERLSDLVVAAHPNNVVFWKTRVRTMYALSQIDEAYLQKAKTAILKTFELAPTDAKVAYNVAVLHGQTGDIQSAITMLEKTIELKPDYLDARYALGLYLRDAATNDKGVVVDEKTNEKAIEAMRFIIQNFPEDQTQQAITDLKNWGVEE